MADAGKYELLDLFWDKRTNDVEKPVPVFHRYVQGEVLDLDEAEATRLVEAGSVAPEGARQSAELERARAAYQAALANLPDELRGAVAENVTAESLADRETPVEELHVHHPEAEGFVNAGHPQYASAAHGQGNAGGPEDTTQDDIAATQASLDDGAKTTRNAREGAREHKAQPQDVADKAAKQAGK